MHKAYGKLLVKMERVLNLCTKRKINKNLIVCIRLGVFRMCLKRMGEKGCFMPEGPLRAPRVLVV